MLGAGFVALAPASIGAGGRAGTPLSAAIALDWDAVVAGALALGSTRDSERTVLASAVAALSEGATAVTVLASVAIDLSASSTCVMPRAAARLASLPSDPTARARSSARARPASPSVLVSVADTLASVNGAVSAE
jgi:hypothetical protein